MSGVARALARLDARLVAPGPAFRLLEVHTLVALVVGLRLATRDWTRIAARPAELTWHGTAVGWFPAPAPAWVLVALQVAGLAGVVLVVARRRPQVGFVLAWVAYMVLTGLWGSSGKVMHNDVLTVSVGAVLLLARVPGRDVPARDARVAWGWPPRAALAVLACVYFLTGAQKVRHSGIEWVLSDNMAWVLRWGESPFGPGLTQAVADQAWLTQLLAGGALCLELGAPLLLALRVTRIPFALAVLVMHTSIWAFLGLDYSAWVLTAAAVAVPQGLPRGVPLLAAPRAAAAALRGRTAGRAPVG
ncbi:conserved hypothetical protein [Cellulomonas flavigena DSM 20109]|uniref:HTTM domain protein n=1 Tax=Cellulomonas flavigena (strain ATCC 482 / DSM 20109 / BCRC 11376 / JCM 18109 / NBRC 3775 / NCIMB 8073 / NRS 134) TaxID=446466 RepID=D5UGF2_CELFN|nr:hypothetical protein [Cellulomonas flavigena]ADG73135.1 conserved hypothetical protein [Cellulomonas flavigena DSM 20109]